MDHATHAAAPALFRRFPQLAETIAWTPLGTFPTPLEPLHPLTHDLFGAELWVKRDDLSGARYGGNKVRKLEFLLGDARRRGARRLITAGATGSHHAFATALYGRQEGFDVTLVLFPQHRTEHVRRILLMDHALGAELRFVPRMQLIPAALWLARAARRADRPIVIPPGGSSPHGTLGYVSAALELAEQLAAGATPLPDVLHVAAGTLGTAAGIGIGLEIAGLPTRVRAARVTSRIVANEGALRRLVARTLALLGRAGADVPHVDAVLARMQLVHGYIGAGYGAPTEAGGHATEAVARAGLVLDPTYTAKAAAAMLGGVRTSPGGVHLFWHTLSQREPVELLDGVDMGSLPPAFRRYLTRPQE